MTQPQVKGRRIQRRAVYQTEWHIKQRIQRLFITLAVLLLIHAFAMMALEGMTLRQSIWLTLTTLSTVGYGDLSASTAAGQFATITLVYLTGITLLTLIVSDYIDYRFYRRENVRAGRWRWNMVNHILIINSPKHGGPQYYIRLVQQLRANDDYKSTPIQLLTRNFPDGLPRELAELGVVHYHGLGTNTHDLSSVNAQQAKHIIILANDSSDPSSDSATFDSLDLLREFNLAKRCIVECVDDNNRHRLARLGALAILRPVRTYPEIIVRALIAPGTEKVLEDLFTHENDHPHRYKVSITDMTWSDVVCSLIQAGLGTAMAYIDCDDEVICNPDSKETITAQAIILLVKTDRSPSTDDVTLALQSYRERLKSWTELKQQNEKDKQ